MPSAFHSFSHLLVRIFVRWYQFLGTSPGGIAAQILIVIVNELRGQWWKLKQWPEIWKGGLKRAATALGIVWILTFFVCILTTVYDDHIVLKSSNVALTSQFLDMTVELDQLKIQNNALQQQLNSLKNSPRPTLTALVPPDKQCWLSNHFGMANSTIKGAVTATAAIVHCNYKIDAPFRIEVEFDRDFIPGALVLTDSGSWMGGGGGKQGKVYFSQVNSPALLSDQLAVVTVYGDTDQYPRAMRVGIAALK
jgi:hypothetical protein